MKILNYDIFDTSLMANIKTKNTTWKTINHENN